MQVANSMMLAFRVFLVDKNRKARVDETLKN